MQDICAKSEIQGLDDFWVSGGVFNTLVLELWLVNEGSRRRSIVIVVRIDDHDAIISGCTSTICFGTGSRFRRLRLGGLQPATTAPDYCNSVLVTVEKDR
jgi:hypothetical protein